MSPRCPGCAGSRPGLSPSSFTLGARRVAQLPRGVLGSADRVDTTDFTTGRLTWRGSLGHRVDARRSRSGPTRVRVGRRAVTGSGQQRRRSRCAPMLASRARCDAGSSARSPLIRLPICTRARVVRSDARPAASGAAAQQLPRRCRRAPRRSLGGDQRSRRRPLRLSPRASWWRPRAAAAGDRADHPRPTRQPGPTRVYVVAPDVGSERPASTRRSPSWALRDASGAGTVDVPPRPARSDRYPAVRTRGRRGTDSTESRRYLAAITYARIARRRLS